jgi:hypothetical protein
LGLFAFRRSCRPLGVTYREAHLGIPRAEDLAIRFQLLVANSEGRKAVVSSERDEKHPHTNPLFSLITEN